MHARLRTAASRCRVTPRREKQGHVCPRRRVQRPAGQARVTREKTPPCRAHALCACARRAGLQGARRGRSGSEGRLGAQSALRPAEST